MMTAKGELKWLIIGPASDQLELRITELKPAGNNESSVQRRRASTPWPKSVAISS